MGLSAASSSAAFAVGFYAGKKTAAVVRRADVVAMWVLTLFFAWLTARTLRGSGAIDEDEVLSAVLWRLSPIICAYFFFCNIAFALSGAASARAVLVRAPALPLLAAAAGKLIAPRGGAALMFLATVYCASASGGALAERRQRAGTDRTAAAAAASAPSYWSRAEVRSQGACRAGAVFFSASCAVMLSTLMLLMSWSIRQEGEGSSPGDGEIFLGMLVFLAGPWLMVTEQMRLNRTPLQADDVTLAWVVPLGSASWIFLAICAWMLVDVIAMVLVLWAGALGMAWFFGYGLAVEAHYMELLAIKRREPRTAKDASGLLDGRDEEDAGSTHIDAASGRCLGCLPCPSRCTC